MRKKFGSIALALCMVASNTQVPDYSVYAGSQHIAKQNMKKANANKKHNFKYRKLKKNKLNPDEKVRIMVEFKEDAVSTQVKKYNKKAKKLEKSVLEKQKDKVKSIEKITGNKTEKQYAYLVNGLSIDAKRSQIDEIAKLKGVKRVYEAKKYTPLMNDAVSEGNVKAVWEDKNLPLDGEGMLVAVVDTGVNYKHKDMRLDEGKKVKFTEEEMQEKIKALGHGKYINDKIPYIHDYIDESDEGVLGIENHGYHVGGIIGANTNSEDGIDGVCPNAQVISMQVFGPNGEGALTDDIVQAIEDSVKLEADVINLSLGAPAGWTDSDDMIIAAVNEADSKGCVVSVAAGNESNSATWFTDRNDNPYGLKDIATVGTPATAESSIAVAACYNSNDKAETKTPKMTEFSSWGPTPELQIKPEVTAPGGNINSLSNDNSYEEMSGTSMATPFITGVSALVKESVAKNNLDIKNDEMTDFVKYSIINTASPIDDVTFLEGKGVPYSVRQQGSGLVNAKNAVDNKVIATYNNDATIELGNVKEGTSEIPISIKLKNYGKEDETYKLADCDLYTDVATEYHSREDSVCDENEYYLEKIKGGKVAYDTDSVTVKAGSEVTINAKVIIPEDMKSNQYLESFVKLDGDIDLNMPLLGFYGNWDDLPIFDLPSNEEGSIMGKVGMQTGYLLSREYNMLGEVYDEEQEGFTFDNSKAAFSTNPEANKTSAFPVVTMLRNAKNVNMSVYDESGKLVRDLGDIKDLEKIIFSREIGDNPVSSLFQHFEWDGTVFNNSTGKFEAVKDGNYKIVLSAKYSKYAKEQKMEFPVSIDSVKPKVETKYTYKNGKFTVYVKASDNRELNPWVDINFSEVYEDDDWFYMDEPTERYSLDKDFDDDIDGYKKLTIDVDEKPSYYSISVSDMAGNFYSENPINEGDSYDDDYYNSGDLDFEGEEGYGYFEDDDMDLIAPTVKITVADDAVSKSEYFRSDYIDRFFVGLLKDETKPVDLYFEVGDNDGILEKTEETDDSDKTEIEPVTFDMMQWIPSEDMGPGWFESDNVPHDIEKVDENTYKVHLTPEELRTSDLIDGDEIVADNFMGGFNVIDKSYNSTYVEVDLFNHDDEEDYNYQIKSNKIPSILTSLSSTEVLPYMEDDKTTIEGTVYGMHADRVLVDGKEVELTPWCEKDTDEIEGNYTFETEVDLKPGYNNFHIEVFKTKDGKEEKVADAFVSKVMYNGEGAKFSVSTDAKLNEGVFECQGDEFNYTLDINSAFDSYDVSIDGKIIHTASDFILSKGTRKIAQSYKIKGDGINKINFKTIDLCGNEIEKQIYVKNVNAKSNNNAGDEVSANSTQNDISKANIKLASKKVYTGKKITPVVTVKAGNTTLKKNVDYKVTYKNNKKIGEAKVLIEGLGKYKGTVEKSFKIVPAKAKIKKVSKRIKGKVTLKVKKLKGGVKYEFFYATKKNGKFKKLGTAKKQVLRTKKLKKGKKYFIKVRAFKKVNNVKYYGKFSKVKSKKF